MYNAIIVDDEYLFRQALLTSFPWRDYEIFIRGEANNGRDALDLLKKFSPEIALIDINMPGMSGLHFIREARALSPATRFLIISGYNNFSYAQEAISLGVQKYLLKPLQNKELASALEELIAQISIQNMEQNKLVSMTECHQYYLSSMRRQLLSELISFPIPSDTARLAEKCSYLELPWCNCSFFYLTVFGIQSPDSLSALYNNADWKENVLKVLEEDLRLPFNGVPCIMEDGSSAILFSSSSVLRKDSIRLELQRIELLLSGSLSLTFRFGISAPFAELSGLPEAHLQACRAMRSACQIVSDSIVFFNEHTGSTAPPILSQQQRVQLVSLFRSLAEKKIHSFLSSLSAERSPSAAAAQNASALYFDVMSCYLRVAKEWQLVTLADSILIAIRNYHPQNDFTATIYSLNQWASELLSMLREKGDSAKSSATIKTLSYIEQHYSEAELTIEIISNALFLNYAYLCSVFKKDTGITINQYVRQFRIRKALQLMDEGCKSISSIAAATGFPNANYFAKCFKKEFDITPSEYLLK